MKTTTKTTKIPSRPREEWAVKEARIFIQESGLNWLPIDPFKIIKQYNWKVRTVGDLSRKTGIPRDQVICGTDSDLWECNGKYCIVYNEKAYRSRIPFTIAHEISHIVLGHLKEFPHLQFNHNQNDYEIRILDREADVFATELLMPLPVLNALGINSAREIGKTCRVSLSTASIRAKEIKTESLFWNYRKDAWLLENFYNYIGTFLSKPIEEVAASFEQDVGDYGLDFGAIDLNDLP